MSEAVRAAIAARRAAAAAQKAQGKVGDDDSFVQPFGSPKKQQQQQQASRSSSPVTPKASQEDFVAISQKSEDELLLRSCSTGRLNLSSRMPALQSLPAKVFSLLDDESPQWYDEQQDELDRRPWYEREDLRVLALANGEIGQIDGRIGDFRALARLELQNNRIPSMPREAFQLVNLTTLNLSKNNFVSFPDCLLALDSLIDLDLSHNRISTLWSDKDVIAARTDRRQWDEENADEEGGVWAGLIARMGSPTKRARPPPPTANQQSQPMRSLRTLNLSNNRLDNAAVGLPNKKSGTTALLAWPPTLNELDLSDNMLRGPLPLSFVGRLKELARLAIGGNGIGDDVFSYDTQRDAASHPFGNSFFANLSLLDLTRCEIDDLQKLESTFGSTKTVFDAPEVRAPANATTAPSTTNNGVAAKQLVRVSATGTAKPREGDAQTLSVVLEGNPLREETFRRKHGISRRVEEAKSDATSPTPGETLPLQGASGGHAPPPSSATSDPVKTALPQSNSPVKEQWELDAEAGLLTEGGRRRARAEAARREREAANGGSPGPQAATPPNPVSRRQQDGVNKTGLSDWDGTFTPSKRNGINKHQQGEQSNVIPIAGGGPVAAASDAGSTLANTKLTKRQSEALGRVPCKFFRSANGCSAGESCPFAHIAPGEGSGSGGVKTVCEFFLKGNCRFGHKCALAHLREGEPMSMDKKNKRAAQQDQRGNKAANGGIQPPQNRPSQDFNSQYNPDQRILSQHSQNSINPQLQHPAYQSRVGGWPTPAAPNRDDFAFGLPDDFNPTLPPYPASGIGRSLHHGNPAMPPGPPLHVPSAPDTFIGSPPSSRAFGSSPFGQSVFYSGSQEDADGVLGSLQRAHSHRKGSFSTSNGLRSSLLRPGFHGNRGDVAVSDVDDDLEEELAGDEHNEEDFLPSSLSDLLTPAELQRRRRSSFLASSASRPITQSMPAEAGDGMAGVRAEFRGLGSIGDQIEKRRELGSAWASPSLSSSVVNRSRYASQMGGGRQGTSTSKTGTSLGFDTSSPANHHAPGQSLPQGLAAGLSRLHLTPEKHSQRRLGDIEARIPGSDRLGRTTGASSAATSTSPAATNAAALSSSLLSSSSHPFGPVGSRNLDDLGPTAPSSILPHRPGGLTSRLPGSFSASSLGDNQALTASFRAGSPSMLAIGSPPAQPGAHRSHGPGGIAINSSAPAKQHPGLHRVTPAVPTQGSPLSLAPAKEEEEEEEGVFELE